MQRLHPMWTVCSRSSILPINMDAKVVVEGRSMVNVISTAAELGYLNVPDNTLIEIGSDEELSG